MTPTDNARQNGRTKPPPFVLIRSPLPVTLLLPLSRPAPPLSLPFPSERLASPLSLPSPSIPTSRPARLASSWRLACGCLTPNPSTSPIPSYQRLPGTRLMPPPPPKKPSHFLWRMRRRRCWVGSLKRSFPLSPSLPILSSVPFVLFVWSRENRLSCSVAAERAPLPP